MSTKAVLQELGEDHPQLRAVNWHDQLADFERAIEQIKAENEPKSDPDAPQNITIGTVLVILSVCNMLLKIIPELRKIYTNKRGELKKPKIWDFPKLVKIGFIVLIEYVKNKLGIIPEMPKTTKIDVNGSSTQG